MIFMILVSYVSALLIEHVHKRKKVILVLYIGIALGLLGYFKYLNFLIDILSTLFSSNLELKTILLPIGISFYTFQCMSYVIDVYRNHCSAQKNLLIFASYVALFPQLIAGPIVRYTTVEREMIFRKTSHEGFIEGFNRFTIGLGKKVLLANNLALIADSIFDSNIHLIPVNVAWVGAISYAMQIYFDFSGYSDMAIGIGRMLGFHFLENFDEPYLSRSITEFWRRWHISLGTWFRDYVYIPLGGNRVSFPRWILNILIVWSLTGLWHGASWNFIFWGLYFALLLIIEKMILYPYLYRHSFFSHVYALFFILIGWVLFRTENLIDCFYYWIAMIDFRHLGNVASLIKYSFFENLPFFLAGLFFCLPSKWFSSIKKIPFFFLWKDLCLTLLFLLCILFIVNESYSPFIYFRF